MYLLFICASKYFLIEAHSKTLDSMVPISIVACLWSFTNFLRFQKFHPIGKILKHSEQLTITADLASHRFRPIFFMRFQNI